MHKLLMSQFRGIELLPLPTSKNFHHWWPERVKTSKCNIAISEACSIEYFPSNFGSLARFNLCFSYSCGLVHSTSFSKLRFLSIARKPVSISAKTTPKLYTRSLHSDPLVNQHKINVMANFRSRFTSVTYQMLNPGKLPMNEQTHCFRRTKVRSSKRGFEPGMICIIHYIL